MQRFKLITIQSMTAGVLNSHSLPEDSLPTLLEFIDVAQIRMRLIISELLKFSRMSTVERMPSF